MCVAIIIRILSTLLYVLHYNLKRNNYFFILTLHFLKNSISFLKKSIKAKKYNVTHSNP